jgi:hypothetical protein
MKATASLLVLMALSIAAAAAEKPRVFITDSKSWEISGGGGGSADGFGGGTHGGARPQTAEIIKTFGERCPGVTINNKQERADYVILLDHEGGKGLIRKDNKVAVFNWDGDSILSRSTRSLGNAVEDACGAITKDWSAKGYTRQQQPAAAAPANPTLTTVAETKTAAQISVSSTPDKADIEIDGNFVGNTPSSIEVAPGTHSVTVRKAGYQPWQRNVKVSGGTVNIAAELQR